MIGPWAAAVLVAGPFQILRPVDPPPRPRDPWVFRSVLDERARMITVALRDEIWLAYDASTCGLRAAWQGRVQLEGAVYDTVHGPQPTVDGQMLLTPELGPDGSRVPAWTVVRTVDDTPLDVDVRYRGYRFLDGPFETELEFWWQLLLPGGEIVNIREQPHATSFGGDLGNGHWELPTTLLQRQFELAGLPQGHEVRLASGLWEGPEGAVWAGTACEVEGGADHAGIAEWAVPAARDLGMNPGKARLLEWQEGRRKQIAAWCEQDAGARREWSVSRIRLTGDGVGLVHVPLRPLPVTASGKGPDGEETTDE